MPVKVNLEVKKIGTFLITNQTIAIIANCRSHHLVCFAVCLSCSKTVQIKARDLKRNKYTVCPMCDTKVLNNYKEVVYGN